MLQRERATACASSVQRYVKLHDRKGFYIQPLHAPEPGSYACISCDGVLDFQERSQGH